jgi:DNA-binding GntR family transcriptional regulator
VKGKPTTAKKPLETLNMAEATETKTNTEAVGRIDPLVIRQIETTLKNCYRKHVNLDDSIGWDELGDQIHNTLCNLIGDDAFVEWNDNAK